MIQAFANAGTEDIFDGRSTKAARKLLPEPLHGIARRKLDALDSAETLQDLRTPPGNRLEALKGDRSGQYSIRVNEQFRLCFGWTSNGPEDVEIVDYH